MLHMNNRKGTCTRAQLIGMIFIVHLYTQATSKVMELKAQFGSATVAQKVDQTTRDFRSRKKPLAYRPQPGQIVSSFSGIIFARDWSCPAVSAAGMETCQNQERKHTSCRLLRK